MSKNNAGKHIAIVGGGWNGVYLTDFLSSQGYKITLYEKNPQIFSGISGNFGIRIHAGPHYPRSLSTRISCQRGYHEFYETYPELINQHRHSIYALAKKDIDDRPSKVSLAQFKNVCHEFGFKSEIDIKKYGYNEKTLLAAYDINEPSAVLGPRLRNFFEKRLTKPNIIIKYNATVDSITRQNENCIISCDKKKHSYDYVINATGYINLLPYKPISPFGIKVVYQPCLALIYEEQNFFNKPMSFIVMDGWFPCLMPYDDRDVSSTESILSKYIMTHGKLTILGSYNVYAQACFALSKVNDKFINKYVKIPAEQHMQLFWQSFSEKYKYLGWTGAVLPKIKTDREFRGTVVFQDDLSKIIYVFPGKITNIFDAGREVLKLMTSEGVRYSKTGYNYIKYGALDLSMNEIIENISDESRVTCGLQTFRHVLK